MENQNELYFLVVQNSKAGGILTGGECTDPKKLDKLI